MKRFIVALLLQPLAAAAVDETIVVTATRTPLAIDDALAPVVVIDADDLRRTAGFDILEAIRFHAGIDIGRNGGPGQTASLFIRGGNSNHTLVLVDGVRMNPGTLGAAALQNVAPGDIERIEIVKGPRSTLYGSEAIGGVVNVITRRAGAPFEAQVEAGAGRWNTRDISAALRGTDDAFYAGVHAARTETDGFPTRRQSAIDRGYDNTTLRMHAGHRAGYGTVELRHWQGTGTTEYLDFFLDPLDQDHANSVSTLEVNLEHGVSWRSRLLASRVTDEIDQNQSADFAHTVRHAFDWQHDLDIAPGRALQAGVYHADERIRAEVFGGGFDERPDVRAGYLQYSHAAGRSRTLVAARHTRHDAFGTHLTWNAEFGFRIDGRVRVTLGAGTAFRAPGSAERFGSGGNPDLDAETSRNLELGLRVAPAASHRIGVQLFQNEIDDLIAFDLATFTLDNIDRARIRGVEITHDHQHGPFSLRHAFTIQQPRDLGSDTLLPRRAERSFNSEVVYRASARIELGANLLAVSERKDSGFSDDFNAGYVLLGLSVNWRVTPQWSADLRIENTLDADYETAHGFNSAGRAAFVRLTWRQ